MVVVGVEEEVVEVGGSVRMFDKMANDETSFPSKPSFQNFSLRSKIGLEGNNPDSPMIFALYAACAGKIAWVVPWEDHRGYGTAAQTNCYIGVTLVASGHECSLAGAYDGQHAAPWR